MKKILAILLVLLMVVSIVGCSDESAIKAVIKDNAKAMEKEDLKGYMASIYADASLYDSTENMIAQVFEMYELDIKIKDIEVIEIDGDEARVRVVQRTRNKNSQPFQDNVTTSVHTLIKDDGDWKIKYTEVEDIDYE